MIKATQVHKTYTSGFFWWKKTVPVLKGFNFEARPGQVTGVLGPNGAGKTTFFRILCGFEKLNSGSIEVDGIDPTVNPGLLRGKIAFLPEEPGVPPEMPGYHHLWVFGAMMGLNTTQIRHNIDLADQTLHLKSFWDRPFSTYSRGQKSRIALARMRLIPEASIFIFDEPSNGLDFEAVSRLHLFIRQLAKEGKTILVASHILSDLRHLCDTMIGIDDGQQAQPQKLQGWLLAHEQSQAQIQAREAVREHLRDVL